MSDPFKINDSSMYVTDNYIASLTQADMNIRLGTIRDIIFNTSEILYSVEVRANSNTTNKYICRPTYRFSGIFNYEEVTHQGYSVSGQHYPANQKVGDNVIVGFINSSSRYGVILGSIDHPARGMNKKSSDMPYNYHIYNGLSQEINNKGEFTITFNGLPTNFKKLSNPPDGSVVEEAIYDNIVGGSYFKFNVDGNVKISDNANDLEQYLLIDKKNKKILLSSGDNKIELDKKNTSISISCNILQGNVSKNISFATQKYNLEATEFIKLKSPKIAIGADGVELLDQLLSLISALGELTAISPSGMCVPLSKTPQWSSVISIQNKIKNITGTL